MLREHISPASSSDFYNSPQLLLKNPWVGGADAPTLPREPRLDNLSRHLRMLITASVQVASKNI